jgi:hypothetical protein
MSTFFSLIGMQPGAVAASTKTMIMHTDVSHILLFPTKKTIGIAERLIEFIRNLKADIEIDFYEVDTFNPEKSAWEAIKKVIQSNSFPGPFYFDTSPGLNFQIARTSLHLQKNQLDVIPLYADNTALHFIEKGTSLMLENIGLENLLKLHQLKKTTVMSPMGKKMPYIQIEFNNEKSQFVDLREYHGRLHCVKDLLFQEFHGIENFEKLQDREKKVLRNKARGVFDVLKTTQRLNHLHPTMHILTNFFTIRRRLLSRNDLKVYYFDTHIQNNQDKIALIQKNLPLLWENVSKHIEVKEKRTRQQPKAMRFNTGMISIKSSGEWKNENLIVNLGSDPASTLLAIFTHQPEELIILVDQHTPIVCAHAEKIKEQKSYIRSKNIHFWPTDLKGNIQFMDALEKKLSQGKWIANITPGTKAQSWQLVRRFNVESWSLNNSRKRAEPLIPQNSETKDDHHYNYRLAPIITQTSIQQKEPLYNIINDTWKDIFSESIFIKPYHGTSLEEIKKRKKFLFQFACVVSTIAQKRKGVFPVHQASWKKNHTLPREPSKFYLKCLNVKESKEEMTFEVYYNKQKTIGMIHGVPYGGHWLEEVVAGAFLEACGAEITDLRVGIKWPWHDQSSATNATDEFKTELDVIFIWRQYYVCISCKLGENKKEIEDIKSEIRAEARECFGRFALPVLVKGGIPGGDQAYNYAMDTMDSEPVEISLCLLNQPNKLKNLLELALYKKSTTKQ